jgi:hypothetical protein
VAAEVTRLLEQRQGLLKVACGLLVPAVMKGEPAEGVQCGRLRGPVASLPGGDPGIGASG